MINRNNPINRKPEFRGARHTTRELQRSQFDLTHEVKTTISMGRIYPFLILETMPGDSFKIKTDILARFLPLYLPVFHQINMEINYFYVPYRLLWSEWETFISKPMEDLTIPQVNVGMVSANFPDPARCLYSYLGLPVPTEPTDETTAINLSAFPGAAYAKIVDEFFRDPDFSTPLFSADLDGTTPANNAWVNDLGKALPVFDYWNRDYFTSATNAPAAGTVLDLNTPITTHPDALLFKNVEGDPAATFPASPNFAQFRAARSDGSDDTNASTLAVISGGAYRLGIADDQILIEMEQLRYNMRMWEFFERLNRTEPDYRAHMRSFYGVDPDPGSFTRPTWFGGSISKVIVGEVMSTAETDTYVVGGYAGQALNVQEGTPATIFTPEFGIIIGTITIKPRSSYYQGISKLWTRESYFDYPLDTFAGVGDQPILRHELFYKHTTDGDEQAANFSVFGYIPRYSELRYQHDYITGQMRNIWTGYHMTRIINDSNSILDEDFLLMKDVKPHLIFQKTSDEDECFLHAYHEITVDRQLPAFSTPHF